MEDDVLFTVDISADGQTTRIEGQNVSGPDCARYTAAIEAALGVVESKTLKPEYYDAPLMRRTVTE